MQRRFLLLAGSALGASPFLAACGGGGDDPAPTPPAATAATPDIVQLAQATPDLSILVEAVTAAGLVGALQQPGPLTVFAPTNAAFAALLTELGVTKDQLLADKALLTSVLQYHVVAGAVAQAQIVPGKPVTPLQGTPFKVDAVGGNFVITDGRNRTSTITRTDIAASNGLVHLVDKVQLPPNRTIVETAQASPGLSILVQALQAAGLDATLAGPGPFTVFAPTDAAFAALLTELGLTAPQLLADTALLTRVLTYHVVPGRVFKADIPLDTPVTTVQGGTIRIGSTLQVTDARGRQSGITQADILASNGVVHLLDRVLLPSP